MEIFWLVFWEKIKYLQGLAWINSATRPLAISRVSYSLNPQYFIGYIKPEDAKGSNHC
jgi:hypothetical protein